MEGSKHVLETCGRSRMSLQTGGKVGSWPAEVLKWLVQGFWGKNEHWVLREVQVQTLVGQVCFCCSFLCWHVIYVRKIIWWFTGGVMICGVVPSSLLAASQKFRTCWGSRAQWHQVSESVLHSVLPVFSVNANRQVLVGHGCTAKECAENWGEITTDFVSGPRMLAKSHLGLWQGHCFKRFHKY